MAKKAITISSSFPARSKSLEVKIAGIVKALRAGATINPANLIDTISIVRKGIEYDDFIKVSHEIPFSLKEWSGILSISERTMQRYEKENKFFEPAQTEKIIQVSLLYNKGVDIFGSIDKFKAWLETQSVALGGNKPKDLLDSNFGIQLVNDELDRIEHGIFA